MLSRIFTHGGYYTTNNEKQDYQFEPPVTVWDESSAAASWRCITGDQAETPEKEMLELWWKGQNEPPKTAIPVIIHSSGGIKLYCDTDGASIGYQVIKNGQSIDEKMTHKILSWDFAGILGRVGPNGEDFLSERPWAVYSSDRPVILSKGDTLIVKAMRIGYQEATLKYVEIN